MDREKVKKEKDQLDKIVGRNIRYEREVRKISRDDLASIIGLTTSHLGLIERGERGATLVTLSELEKALGVSVNKFLAEKDSYKKEPVSVETYRKKAVTLISQLDETELKMLIHSVKAVLELRENK